MADQQGTRTQGTPPPGTPPPARKGARTAPDSVRSVRSVHSVAANLAGGVLIVITLVVLAGIASRAVFGRPIPSSNELIGSCLMVALIYLSVPAAKHLRITVFTRRLPAKAAVWVERAVLGVCAAGLAVAAWAALTTALFSLRTGESTVGLHTFGIGPFRLLIFAGTFLLLVRVALEGRSWLREEHDVEAHGDGTDGDEVGDEVGAGTEGTGAGDEAEDGTDGGAAEAGAARATGATGTAGAPGPAGAPGTAGAGNPTEDT